MRIVSLLPSTTEILFAIGAGDDVVGVTFECDFPRRGTGAADRVDVGDARGAGSRGDRRVRRPRDGARARTSTTSPADALAELDADLVVTQDLCAVCAVDVSVVDDALAYLGCTAQVLTIDPHTLDEVFELDRPARLGDRRMPRRPTELVGSLRSRLAAVRARVAGLPRPRVMLLEWTDPPYAPGHWVPEMISAAGGEPLLGKPGAKSERVLWESIHEAGAGRHRLRAVRLRPGRLDRARRRAGRIGRAAARRTRARRRRERLLGPPRHTAGRRGGGTRGDPAPRLTVGGCG